MVDTSTIKVEGQITLNGVEQSSLKMHRHALLVSSQDNCIPNLTVRENIEFVYDCLVPPSRGEYLVQQIKSANSAKGSRDTKAADIESQEWKEYETDLMYVPINVNVLPYSILIHLMCCLTIIVGNYLANVEFLIWSCLCLEFYVVPIQE